MPSRLLSIATLAASVLTVAACAPASSGGAAASAAAPRVCFHGDQVRNFRAGEPLSVFLRAQDGTVFEARSSGICRDLETTNTLVISALGGGSRLCVGDFASIAVRPFSGPASVCRAQITRALSEAEVEALPSRYRP